MFGPEVTSAARRLSEAIEAASASLVRREHLSELVVLGAVAGEHVLVVGPPGTAKSVAVRRVAQAIHGRYFEYLLGRFTEPSELFGPIDLVQLRAGKIDTVIDGMLPEAEVVFLDEVFLGSSAILNTLLGVLNERVFRRGRTPMPCPLRVCVGASNALPDDPTLAAFADRFTLRVFLDPVPDAELERLLEAGRAADGAVVSVASIADVDRLALARREVELAGVTPDVAHVVRRLKKHGVELTDRRVVKLQRLIAASAALAGRAAATRADLWPIVYAIPDLAGQEDARELLKDLLAESENPLLGAATLDAAQSRQALADRLVRAAGPLLDQAPRGDPRAAEALHLKIEGVLREIDAAFDERTAPAELWAVRARLVGALPGASP